MSTYLQVVVFSLLGGIFSLCGGILLLSRKSWADDIAKYATPFAAGALLAAVFIDLLHDGLETAAVDTVLIATMIGIVLFFFAERFLRWFHHHHQHDKQRDPTTLLIIIGDILHNALDGIAIAAAFLVSPATGVVTTLAVAAHEIPQEIGDFGLLLNKGLSRTKVLLVNIGSALATTLLAVITFALGSTNHLPVGVLLGLSAGMLLYIAMSDIIPTLHEDSGSQRFFTLQPLLLVLGIVTVWFAVALAHRIAE